MSTAADVAQWMVDEILRLGYAEQEIVAFDIERKFGKDFVYDNDNGNLSIDPKVLKEFRKRSEETIVWVRSEKAWRKREDHDDKGRMQE